MAWRDAAIAGVYMSRQGDLSEQTQPEVYWECVLGALADAGIEPSEADAYIESVVGPLTSQRLMVGQRVGTHKGQWGSLSKLQGAVAEHDAALAALTALGADGVIWDGEEVQLDNVGTAWLGSRGGTIAGGTNEMQRNIVSERLLGLPREPSTDRDLPFNEVIRNLGRN